MLRTIMYTKFCSIFVPRLIFTFLVMQYIYFLFHEHKHIFMYKVIHFKLSQKHEFLINFIYACLLQEVFPFELLSKIVLENF